MFTLPYAAARFRTAQLDAVTRRSHKVDTVTTPRRPAWRRRR